MGRNWKHDVDPDWLRARRSVLTASDVVSLLPAYKRWKKLGDPDAVSPEFSAMWAEKATITEPDTSSVGAAARGHIMEPWAVESWNGQSVQPYYHWDDCIIVNGTIGFSPDAMDIPMPDGNVVHSFWEPEIADTESIMEVKCYSPSNHMKAVCAGKKEHPERMQVAMAFAVLPGLTHARLLWFCPNAPISMYSEEYFRDDLADEIELVHDVAEVYRKHALHWSGKLGEYPMHALCTEDDVWNDFVLSQQGGEFVIRKDS